MFREFLAYEASAGSGKTFNLVVRYLSLLFMDEKPSQIIALTFTNKAANEMLSRIIDTLENLQTCDAELEQISAQTSLTVDEILQKRPRVLARFLASSIEISTIDKFFGSILRRFAINSSLNPNFATVQNHDRQKLLNRFLLEIESATQSKKVLDLMKISDKRVVNLYDQLSSLYAKHKEFDLSIFENTRYKYSKQDEILKLALELSREILECDISERARKTMSIDDYDDLLLKTWLFRESLNYWDFKKIYKPSMDDKLHHIQSLLLYQMRFSEEQYFHSLFELLKLYITAREKMIRAESALSFDDITLAVHSLLRGKIDSEFLYFRLDSQIKHILLDEFQDTSILQFDIISPLIDELTSGAGVDENRSFFFVGDVKQSIYRFRGGVSELFYHVADRYGVTVEPLRVNYRSSKGVVEFVNRLFVDKIDGYTPQQSSSADEGYVKLRISDEPLEQMLIMIKELLDSGVDMDDITVLTTTNSDGSKAEEILLENGYSVVTEATIRLIEQKNIRAVIEYFKYCYFKADIYKYSVISILGIDDIEIIECENLPFVATEFFERFGIGDSNALIFIEILSRYRDIEQFVFEIEMLEEPSFMNRSRGIRVMTIHKSKGLEFEHVIVLDRLGQKSRSTSPIIYEYDGIRLKNLYLRIKNRDALDKDYSNALKLEELASHKDHLNALYVALTRSVSTLMIIQKSRNSYFEPLELSEFSSGGLEVTKKAIVEDYQVEKFNYQSISFGRQNIEIKSKELHNIDSIEFGLALHYTLEMMGRYDMSALEVALQSSKNRYGQYISDDAFAEIYSRIERLVNDEFFKSITDGEIYKEQTIKDGDKIGVIDLLIETDDSWIVVDYKSGQELDEHLLQVARYTNIIDKLDNKKVYGYLCYINSDKIVWKKCL